MLELHTINDNCVAKWYYDSYFDNRQNGINQNYVPFIQNHLHSITLLLADESDEFTKLKEFKPPLINIPKNSKIFFCQYSKISPLYLSKLNIDSHIKRVLSPEKADYIIASDDDLRISANSWYYTSKCQHGPNGDYRICTSNCYVDTSRKKILEDDFNVKLYYYQSIKKSSEKQFIELYLKYPNKIISDMSFVKYIYQFLPVMDNDTFQNTLDLLRSSNIENYKLGINCLQYYNLSNVLLDLYLFYIFDENLTFPKNYSSRCTGDKFLNSLINKAWTIRGHRGIPFYCKSDLKKILLEIKNHPLMNSSTDEIAQALLKKYLNEIHNNYYFRQLNDALSVIGYTIELKKLSDNDSNRETESSDREVESI